MADLRTPAAQRARQCLRHGVGAAADDPPSLHGHLGGRVRGGLAPADAVQPVRVGVVPVAAGQRLEHQALHHQQRVPPGVEDVHVERAVLAAQYVRPEGSDGFRRGGEDVDGPYGRRHQRRIALVERQADL